MFLPFSPRAAVRRTPPRTRLRVRLLPEASVRASLMPSGLGGVTRSAHCWCAGLARTVSICWSLGCMLRIAIGHTVSPSCSCVSSRRVARIRPLRPMCQGYFRSAVWMRSITASIRSRGTASSFVRGGFRPARGGLSGVVPGRDAVFPIVLDLGRLAVSHPTVMRCGFLQSPSSADECPAGCPLLKRLVWVSRDAFVVVVPVVEVRSLDALGLCVVPRGSLVNALLVILDVVAMLFPVPLPSMPTGWWFLGCVGWCCPPTVVAMSRRLGRTAALLKVDCCSRVTAACCVCAPSGWWSRWWRRSIRLGNAMRGSCSLRRSRRSVAVPGQIGRCAGSGPCAAGCWLAGSASQCRAARCRADSGGGGNALVVRFDCGESWRVA